MINVFGRFNAVRRGSTSLLRVVTGLLLAWHGYRKLPMGSMGSRVSGAFSQLRATATLAVAVALLELVGGILLAVGLLTRPVALLFVVEFTLIFLWVKLNKLDSVVLACAGAPAVELDLLYLSLNAFFLTAGPGPLAADHMTGLDAEHAGQEPAPAVR